MRGAIDAMLTTTHMLRACCSHTVGIYVG
jgi:hypothetical protein